MEHDQERHGRTSFCKTCFNGLNALTGIGILPIPYAFSQGGWISLLILLLVPLLYLYTGLLLRHCMKVHPLIKTYPDIGAHAFGHRGRAILSLLLYIELYLVAVEFLILGDNLDKMFSDMDFEVVGLMNLPTTWLKNFGELSYLSAGRVWASVVLPFSIFWVGLVDGVAFHERGDLLNRKGLLTATSMISFS